MRFLLYLAYPLLYFISVLYPKKSNLWVFGAWFGQKYNDSSRCLYEAAINDRDIEAIWVTKNKQVYSYLVGQNYPVVYAYSLEGILKQLQAGVFVCCVNSKDFFEPLVTPKSYTLQLWHGSPLKKIGFDVRVGRLKYIVNFIRSKLIDNYSAIVSPSSFFDDVFMSAFRISADKIIRSPYPRCDLMFPKSSDKELIMKKLGINENCKVLSYIPTHRSEGREAEVVKRQFFDFCEYSGFFNDLDIKVYFKPHFYDLKFFDDFESDESVFIVRDQVDIYELLSVTDILVTDYSSVFFDFFVTERKCLFLSPDLEEYIDKNRDLYFRYDDLINTRYSTVHELYVGIKNGCDTGLNQDLVFSESFMGDNASGFLLKVVKERFI